jgi:EmrB/QacA subfamily drug resistance transporter
MPAPLASLIETKRRWIALIVVCFAMVMNVLDQTIVNVALPTLQRDLHFSQASLAWVVDAYLITFGGALLLAGRLGDLIGRKKVFLVGVAVFTLASAACGAADSQAFLIIARFVQGLGAALSSSVILAIIVADFPNPAERTRAMNSYILVAVGGGSFGLLIGGWVTQLLSWHWIFFINLPVGVATFLAGLVLLDENEGIGVRAGIDVMGAVLSTAGLMLAVYAIVSTNQYAWASGHTIGFGAAALVVLVAFVALERRHRAPIMPVRVLRADGLLTSSAVRALMVVGMYCTGFIGVLYLQHVLAYDPVRTGLAFLPQTLAVALISQLGTTRLTKKIGPKPTLLLGMFVLAIGLTLIATAGTHTAYFPQLFLGYLPVGIGAALAFSPLLTMAVRDVPKADAGIGSGIVNVSQQVSAALAIAILGTIATDRTRALAHTHSVLSALDGGYRLAFLVAVGCVLVGAVLGAFILKPAREDHTPEERTEEMAELVVAEVF